MASRFTGRDYSTLRQEIIEFLATKLPNSWDSTNLADPVVIFAETLARVGDELHYTIDELRRECDVSTARRASSIYSYAMREGYKMMLPKGSHGTISVNSTDAMSGRMKLSLNYFDEIKVGQTGISLYVANKDGVLSTLYTYPDSTYLASLDKNDYANYANNIYNRTVRFNVVLGKKETFNFTYNDINTDSTVTLPNAIIDRDLIRLRVNDNNHSDYVMTYTDDIIASGFIGDLYTLTPKFIGGVTSLNIEFPTDYRTMFDNSATFSFEYIKIQDVQITEDEKSQIDLSSFIIPEDSEDEEIDTATVTENNGNIISGGVIIDLNNGIKGYTEYENPNATRENYKNFIQNYSALLTKNDFINYCKIATTANCEVFDHSDNYKNVLPPGTMLEPRIIYILIDAPYSERENLWLDLTERTSRSDIVRLIPYGKDPYTIIVKAECYLLGTSVSEIATQIKSELLQYYSGDLGEKVPEISKINYLAHKASDKVIRMDSLIVRDSTFGEVDDNGKYIVNKDFDDVSKLSNDNVDTLFMAIKNGNTSININNKPDRLAGIDVDGNYYNKYPVVQYNKYPDSFPGFYYFEGGEEKLVEGDVYDYVVRNMLTYDYFDKKEYDVEDKDIFNKRRSIIRNVPDDYDSLIEVSEGEFLTDSFLCENTSSARYYSKSLSHDYVNHHYIVPVLNRVIVLVKAIGN